MVDLEFWHWISTCFFARLRTAYISCPSLWFYWRASEASETLSGVYKFELVRYICMEVRVPY